MKDKKQSLTSELIRDVHKLRAEKEILKSALKIIAQMNSPMGFAGCPSVARQALAQDEMNPETRR
jgi:hypothetical protein